METTAPQASDAPLESRSDFSTDCTSAAERRDARRDETNAPVIQLDRCSPSKRRGCRFDPCQERVPTYPMKLQITPYSCGSAALVNALRCYGVKIAEMRVKKLAGTTKDDGTNEHGILDALKALKFKGEMIETHDEDDAWKEIVYGIEIGHPVILCVSNLQHWVTVVGKLGNKFLVIDPSNAMRNKAENGVAVLNKTELLKRWKSRSGLYTGIVCKK